MPVSLLSLNQAVNTKLAQPTAVEPIKPLDAAEAGLRQINEPERLEALKQYQILDTEPEKPLTDLVQLAALICGTPIALLSLIDGERQWFKANVGMDAKQIPRAHAFCQYAMRADDVYEISDAFIDQRFASNPLVTGVPHIRFYAGVPLLTPEGHPLGTLCVLDTVPRYLNDDQREALRILSRQVMAQLEIRRIHLHLEDERQKLAGVLSMANGPGKALPNNSRHEIFIKQEQRLVRIATADLQYVEALGDYVNLHTTRERFTVYGTMKDLETKLNGGDFARIHRKYIVRLDRILAIEADVALLDFNSATNPTRLPVRVPIGSSYKTGLLGRLNLL